MCVARHDQTNQNNRFTIFLQYPKKNMKDEVEFLLADKRQRFLQIDSIILGVCGQACPNYMPKNNKFAISLQYRNKEVSDEVELATN